MSYNDDYFEECIDKDELRAFDYPPHGITRDMLTEWDKKRRLVSSNTLANPQWYHVTKSFKHFVLDGLGLFLLIKYPYNIKLLETGYYKLIEKLSDKNFMSYSGDQLFNLFLTAGFFTLIVKSSVDFTCFITGTGPRYAEEHRREKLKKLVTTSIAELHEQWVEKGKIDSENKPWCLRIDNKIKK